MKCVLPNHPISIEETSIFKASRNSFIADPIYPAPPNINTFILFRDTQFVYHSFHN